MDADAVTQRVSRAFTDHQWRYGKRGVDKGLGDGDQHCRAEVPRQIFALHALDVEPGAGFEQDQREE
jgi:hypothetical protein